jgi:Ubiquitin-2 like Rad60 SUMO-like
MCFAKSTTIMRMIQAFRTARHVTKDKQVFLQFDGDRLDPEIVVADTELGDMDHVEVYVR